MANLFSYLRWMPSSPKGLNTATLSIPKLLIPYCWFPCPFPNPVSTCSYLVASCFCMEQGKRRHRVLQSFLYHCHWVVFTHPQEESWFPELLFSLTIPIGYFLVVVYVQQNKSSWFLSVGDAFILLLCCLFLLVCSTSHSCHLLLGREHLIPNYVDKHVSNCCEEQRGECF